MSALLAAARGCCGPHQGGANSWVRERREERGGRGQGSNPPVGLRHKVLSAGLSLPEPSTLTFREECRE